MGAVGVAACEQSSQGGGRPLPVPTNPSLAGGKRPNMVVIVSDDHRWDHMSFVPGHPPFLRTPALDRLASQGMVGANAFVTTALCSPSRGTLLSGEYASKHGVINNLTPWNPDVPTFFESLMAAGYDNAFIGKWHMPGALPDLRGLDTFITFTAEEGQGKYIDCPLLIDGVMTEQPDTYLTNNLTTRAMAWIDARPEGRPWCLYLAHKAVHHQWIPPKDLEGSLDGIDFSNLPPEAFEFMTLMDRNIWEGTVGRLQSSYKRYCETVLSLDQQVGRLVDHLDTRGLRKDTYVVYTSDNGYSWGEHVLTGKRWAYEENTRVPFIATGPGISPGTTQELLLNADLGPTLLAWGRAGDLPRAQGRSMAALLAGQTTSWRRDFLYEYFPDFPYNAPGMQASRDDRWLYIEYDSGPAPQLFDIRSDPTTVTDLAASHPAEADAMAQRLLRLRTTVDDGGVV